MHKNIERPMILNRALAKIKRNKTGALDLKAH